VTPHDEKHREPAGADNLVISSGDGRSARWRDLPETAYAAPSAAVVPTGFDALSYVWHHALTGDELLVVAEARMEADLRAELLDAGFHLTGAAEGAATRPRAGEPDRLWLLTSGSTGRPKRIGHSLATLTTVSGLQEKRRWLNPYAPGSYAWWQVVTLGLTQPGQDVVLVDRENLDRWTVAAAEHRVTAASGTPTFWRQALMTQRASLANVPLEQITLGGEPVDQAVMDQLRAVFPDARISWIYASSEVGASIVVHDGRAGFPEEWLGRTAPGRPVIDVVDDELVITSPHHGEGLDGAVRTGDRVERFDGRVLITGRLDADEINVGGSKVSAGVVRNALQAHPRVAWAHVKARKAPIVGALVQATVVPAEGVEPGEALEQELAAWCREHLPEYGVPRRFVFRDSIPVKESLKSDV
jgi:acyl-coenzyme A synthetase/AMP-(fatty) acid ligase